MFSLSNTSGFLFRTKVDVALFDDRPFEAETFPHPNDLILITEKRLSWVLIYYWVRNVFGGLYQLFAILFQASRFQHSVFDQIILLYYIPNNYLRKYVQRFWQCKHAIIQSISCPMRLQSWHNWLLWKHLSIVCRKQRIFIHSFIHLQKRSITWNNMFWLLRQHFYFFLL